MNTDEIFYALRKALIFRKGARALRCTCSSFALQYEGGCHCERGRNIAKAQKEIEAVLDKIVE